MSTTRTPPSDAGSADASRPRSSGSVAYRPIREDDLEMTARDGTVLRADVYRPDAPGRTASPRSCVTE